MDRRYDASCERDAAGRRAEAEVRGGAGIGAIEGIEGHQSAPDVRTDSPDERPGS